MKHLAKVYSGGSGTLVMVAPYDLMGDAVNFCDINSRAGDRCVVREGYESLTGTEEYTTIITWIKEKENKYV